MTTPDFYSPQALHSRMAEYQRQGIGLMLGDDGHWHADHLEGLEQEQVELAVNADLALTHQACEATGTHWEAQRTGIVHGTTCLICQQSVVVNIHGKIMPHTVRVNADLWWGNEP